MSSAKSKKKSEKAKTKKIKRAPLKDSYSEEEKVVLKKKYSNILFHLSNFLSEHNVYEAVPENVKILVFNSELSFYEMIKVFIFEDIYCGLIYDAKLNNYLGLVTTRDLMVLYKYIIDNFPQEEISDFDCYLKHIFSQKISKNKKKKFENNINNNINIFKHLQNINYIDYLMYAKKINFQNIHLLSVSLDDNLLETLEKINIKNIHRLLVEEDNKKSENCLPKIKSSKKIKEEEMKKRQKEGQKKKKRYSKTEKTTTTNYSDEESKNNVMIGKKENMQIIEEKTKEEIIDNKNNVIISEESHKEELKHVKKKVVKKKKKFIEENKDEEMHKTKPNNEEQVHNKEENHTIKKKKKNYNEHQENGEEEHGKEEKDKEKIKNKKKIIIKQKEKHLEDNEQEILAIIESKTDDELAAKTKIKSKIKTRYQRKSTTDEPVSISRKKEKFIDEKLNDEKKIIKKKIIIKKIIKKKKKDDINGILNINKEKSKNQTVQENIKININEEKSIENTENSINIKSTTEATEEPSMEKKDKYELPKIKIAMKRNTVKNRVKRIFNEEIEKNNHKETNIENGNKENMNKENGNKKGEKIIKEERRKYEKETEELLRPYTSKYNKELTKNGLISNKKKKMEEEKKEEISIENNEKKRNKKEKNEENKRKVNSIENIKEEDINVESNIKREADTITDILEKAHLDEMKNYIGIVTNETIFEYLVLNYYSNEMKEFNITLNELLALEDISFLKRLDNGKDMKEKAYQTFNNYLFNNSTDIIPIFNKRQIEGFIYPKDFFYYIYNCESKQSLTNEEFLISLYKDIDKEKPYGKNRVIYLELNNKNKSLFVKELIEKLNCSIEKKIILFDPSNNNLFLISLRTIFRAITEFQSNNK